MVEDNYQGFCANIENIPGRLDNNGIHPTSARIIYEKIGSGLNIGYFVYEGENIVVTSGFGVGQLNKDKEIEKYLAEHKSQFIEVMSGILNKRKISLLEGKVDIWKNSKVGAS